MAKPEAFESRRKSFLKEVRSMAIARRTFPFRQTIVNKPDAKVQRCEKALLMILGLCFVVLCSGGCGQTAKPVTSSSAGLVDSYFGGPFNVAGSDLAKSSSTFDHAA